MSSEVLTRDRGVIIRCDFGAWDDEPGYCDASIHTGNVLVKVNRAAAKKVGWIKGGEGRKRCDYCPAHAPVELKRQADAKLAKDAAKKARTAAREERQKKSAIAKAEKHQRAAERRAKRAARFEPNNATGAADALSPTGPNEYEASP